MLVNREGAALFKIFHLHMQHKFVVSLTRVILTSKMLAQVCVARFNTSLG